MLKHAIKLVNKYMGLDADDRDAFDSLRRDRLRLESSRTAEAPKKRRRRRPKTQATDVTNFAPESAPEPKTEPKKRGRKPKQKTIDEAIAGANTEDPLDAALKGVV